MCVCVCVPACVYIYIYLATGGSWVALTVGWAWERGPQAGASAMVTYDRWSTVAPVRWRLGWNSDCCNGDGCFSPTCLDYASSSSFRPVSWTSAIRLNSGSGVHCGISVDPSIELPAAVGWTSFFFLYCERAYVWRFVALSNFWG